MNALLNDQLEPETGARRLAPVYLKLVGVGFLVVGLMRAGVILGINAEGTGFLDLDPAGRAGSVALVSLDLFAATGLWLAAAWGPVIWAVAAIVEIAMHTVFAGRFGANWLAVLAHSALFAVYGALKSYEWWREYRA